MGLFERLGREVEEFKQTAQRTAEESADYRCDACGERFHAAREECAACGAEQIERIDGDGE